MLKDLLRKNIDAYEEWAPEIDRAVRWTAVMLGPMAGTQSYVESNVPPLSELPEYASRFQGIPSAKQLYETLDDKRSLPLGRNNLVHASIEAGDNLMLILFLVVIKYRFNFFRNC